MPLVVLSHNTMDELRASLIKILQFAERHLDEMPEDVKNADRRCSQWIEHGRNVPQQTKRAIVDGLDAMVEHIPMTMNPMQVLARVRDLVENTFQTVAGVPTGSCGTFDHEEVGDI